MPFMPPSPEHPNSLAIVLKLFVLVHPPSKETGTRADYVRTYSHTEAMCSAKCNLLQYVPRPVTNTHLFFYIAVSWIYPHRIIIHQAHRPRGKKDESIIFLAAYNT